MIYIDSKKKKEATLLKKYPNAKILDVTSNAENGLRKLSPFYPHGDIPIPFSQGLQSYSVEGIWQGLKVFEKADIDTNMFLNTSMKNLKRTVKKFGYPLGHRKGVKGIELLSYIEARIKIYLPSYRWVLVNKVSHIVERLKKVSQEEDIVLLDYETNCNVLDAKRPLSHAYLIKSFIEGNYPEADNLNADIAASSLQEKEFKQSKKKTKKTPSEHQPALF